MARPSANGSITSARTSCAWRREHALAVVQPQHARVEQIVVLRLRVVPERGYRTWGERIGGLILLAEDEAGWLSLVGLTNRGFFGGADRGKPRVD